MPVFKICVTALLALLIGFVVSWFYKLLLLGLILWMWHGQIARWVPWPYTNKVIAAVWIVLVVVSLPRYRWNSSDRVRLIYQDEQYRPINPPLLHYAANALVPEEEVMNAGVHVAGKFGNFLDVPVGGSLREQMSETYGHDPSGFSWPTRSLRRTGNNPLSGTMAQMGNMAGVGGGKTQSVYVIAPEDYDAAKTYPVVVFCHGYLGNWRLYQGVLKDLKNCIVISVGTDDLSGIFSRADIKAVFDHQLPFLERLGYKIDRSQVHLIGLSNGGSAAQAAFDGFSHRLKSITYMSCSPSSTRHVPCQINLIGGGKDHASSGHPGLLRSLRANGVDADMQWLPEANHYTLLEQRQQVVDFLNRRFDCKPK